MRDVFTLRASETEKERWRRCSDGVPVSSWLRQLANEECARIEAERREAENQRQVREDLKKRMRGENLND